jgi:hypothetical protein
MWRQVSSSTCSSAAGVCQEWETLLELCPSILEVAYKHQRLAEAVGGLEHESGLVGRELEQNAAGLAEVEGLGHLAIQHGRRPEPEVGDAVAPAVLVPVSDRERDVVHRSGAHLAGVRGRLVVDEEAVTAVASRPPGSLALGLHSEHLLQQGPAFDGVGAVCAHGVDPADRDVPVDVRGVGEQRLVPAVIDHQLERQPVRV